jgi:hypothetical protein
VSGERVIWSPQRKQAEALKNNSFELLYGGAAGGGKTDFLLTDYLGFANEWRERWTGILFRQTYPELDAIIQRARELYLPLGAVWNKSGKTFEFPTGSKLYLRFLENEKDVIRYQGQSYTWVGFDEVGNYPTDYVWKYMMSRLRSAAGAPCYIRGTANPGGKGHMWLKARFIDGREAGKIYKIPIQTREGVRYTTRCFIPSLVTDNRKLLENDPGYVTRLELLPGYLRRALLEGDWDVFAGQAFDEFRRETHVVKPYALPAGEWHRFYSFDWGYAKPFSLGKWAVNGEGRMVRYGEWYGCDTNEMNTGIRLGAEEVAAKAWAMAIQEGVCEMVADSAMWSKEDAGPSIADKFKAAGFRMIPANKDRLNGLAMLHQRMITKGADGRPMLLIFDHCHAFIRTIPALTPDPTHLEDIDSKLEDHVYDEARYAVMSRFAKNPASALRRQYGQWGLRSPAKWDPLAE